MCSLDARSGDALWDDIGETRLAMQDEGETGLRRRDLLSLIGTVAGSSAMYQAMTSLGFASESHLQGAGQSWRATSRAPRS